MSPNRHRDLSCRVLSRQPHQPDTRTVCPW
jgi:hypothetical protein